jgi:predicted HTH domain antitoxin
MADPEVSQANSINTSERKCLDWASLKNGGNGFKLLMVCLVNIDRRDAYTGVDRKVVRLRLAYRKQQKEGLQMLAFSDEPVLRQRRVVLRYSYLIFLLEIGMESVNVSGLKNNPSEALRRARKDVVVVMNRDKPDALMVGIEAAGVLDVAGVRPALATALFRDGNLSLARAAHLANMSLSQFVSHVSRLGIAVVSLDDSAASTDMDTLDEWLAAS